MYYVRTFKSGGGDHDPRQKRWAEYRCHCGHEHQVDITRNKKFDETVDILCPSCKTMSLDDDINKIEMEIIQTQAKLDTLLKKKENIKNGVFEHKESTRFVGVMM